MIPAKPDEDFTEKEMIVNLETAITELEQENADLRKTVSLYEGRIDNEADLEQENQRLREVLLNVSGYLKRAGHKTKAESCRSIAQNKE